MPRGELHVKPEAAVEVFVDIEANTVTAADVLQRRSDLVGGARLHVKPVAEVAGEPESS